MELLFLIGVAWACSRAIEGLRKPASARWAKYRKARSARDNSPAGRAKRRAASTAVLGFWAGEITRGLPHIRHGFAQGWAEHREQLTQRERERAIAATQRELAAARQDADDAGWWNRIMAEMAAHKHRLEVARQAAQRPPTMSEQLGTYPGASTNGHQAPASQNGDDLHMRGANCTDPDCSCHASDPPLADGKTPGNGAPSNGHKPTSTGGTVAEGNGAAGGSGEMNYDETIALCDELTTQADELANAPAFEKAQGIDDQLGGMLNNDSGALSKAAAVAQDIRDAKTAITKLQDDSASLHDHIESNYGPIVEATDAAEGDAPEKEFVSH